MAFNPNELFASTTRGPALRVEPLTIQPKTFGPVGAAPLYPKLTPLGFDTSLGSAGKWVVWANAGGNGSNAIAGFVADDDGVQIDAANDVPGNVIMRGKIHWADIPLPAGETQANLNAKLRSGPRALGLEIQGLDAIH